MLQQRGDNGNPEDFFYKDWTDYAQGFGDPEKVKTVIQLETPWSKFYFQMAESFFIEF